MYKQEFKRMLEILIIELNARNKIVQDDSNNATKLISMTKLKNLWKQYPREITYKYFDKEQLRKELINQLKATEEKIKARQEALLTTIDEDDSATDIRQT